MRKEKMKIYHGIPKSVTDEHTILYADFDGNTHPFQSTSKTTYKPSCTGYGVDIQNGEDYRYENLDFNDVITVDLFYTYTSKGVDTSNKQYLIRLSKTNKTTFKSLRIRKDRNELQFSAYNDNTNLGDNVIQILEDGQTYHFRMVLDGYLSTIYVNGVKKLSITDTLSCKDLNCAIIGLQTLGWGATGIYSDLHISNIDRGDYFPNLPQDFIDGKAIIKPRMNQQQIKGDPLYSQVTELLVDSSAKIPKPYSNIANSDGTYIHLYKPELSVLNADLWNSTSKLKIRGLNGEVISGVIDTDTALGRVISVTKLTDNSARVTCDCFSKISNGDTLNFANINSFHTNSWVDNGFWGVVSELNSSSNSFVVTTSNGRATIPAEGDFILETTTSSSSPIVKTQDGTTVVGTWSGLGTNEATFTLGTNADLSGKDLYVTYSLNIPNGNSDFPELPYSVDRAYNETGLEMKPVTEIVIEDDFRGKVMGDLVNCPHISKFHNYTTLVNPTDNWAGELPTSNYNLIQSLDGTTNPVLNTLNNHIPQQLFSFNLIEMVERKLGCEIPSRDKVQWLKDNIINHTITHYGYGVCPNGNKLYFRVLNGSSWNGTWEHSRSSSDTPTKCYWKGTGNKPGGFIHFLVYTDASDGVTQSAIYTDYVNLEIKLKIDSTFTTLYCGNKRAREDSCNPVLIQKETKTVKRYLPSKECFVTDSSYINTNKEQGNIKGDNIRKKLIEDGYIYVTTLGTGAYSDTEEYYRNCLNYVGDSYIKSIGYNLSSKALYKNKLIIKDIKFTRVLGESNNNDNRYLVPKDIFDGDYICLKPFLMVKSSELILTLSLRYVKNRASVYHTELEYKLPNRPLIK